MSAKKKITRGGATPRVVITGASAGIGEALAREYASQGASVALLARRGDKISMLARELMSWGGRTLAIPCDVREQSSLEGALGQVEREWGGVDIVIANAGFAVLGSVEELTMEDFRRQFETNVWGALGTAKAAIPHLKKTRGRLALVGSVKGTIAVPGGAAYAMSKFAVKALALSLEGELRPHGVSVTHLAPGYVETEFRNVDNDGQYRDRKVDQEKMPAWMKMSARNCARIMRRAIEQRRFECVITGHGKFLVAFFRHFPGTFRWLLRRSGVTARPSAGKALQQGDSR